MYGPNVGSLNVYLTRTLNGDLVLGEPILDLSGNQGNFWHIGRVNLIAKDFNYENVMFEAIVGSGFQGDIALDDISIRNGRCE